jgi:uncharacterized protein (DUF2141 family)
MDRYIVQIIGIALGLLIGGCGQVGFITGGEDDRAAPQPIHEKITPPMASINVKPDRIVIPFNEFITLNNPLQNIRVIPDNVKLNYRIKGKSLVIEKESGEWLDNTTYAIYFKRAVKDITEGNDSIMTYVFATGNYLDSLTFAVRVIDAFTNKPLENIVVGVYTEPLLDDTSKVNPTYAGITDKEGLSQFSYLKEGPFYVYAFDDKNKNNRLNDTEMRGAVFAPVIADTSVTVIPDIRLMPPLPALNSLKSIDFVPPARFHVKFELPLPQDVEMVFLNDQQPLNVEYSQKRDSLTLVFPKLPKSGKLEFLMNDRDFPDTLSKKYFYRLAPLFEFTSNLDKGMLLVGDTILLKFSDALASVQLEEIEVKAKRAGDSVFHPIAVEVNFPRNDHVQIVHQRDYDSVALHIPKSALQGYNLSSTEAIELTYEIQPKSKVGNLVVQLDSIPENGILQLLNPKKEVVRSVQLHRDVMEYAMNSLQPASYTFRIIVDANGDGFWSSGNIFEQREAEQVIWFDAPSQVRANWDVNAKLELIATPSNETPLEEE